MGRLNSRTKQFVEQVKAELHSYGFRLCFGRGKMVNGGGWRAAGFFCDRQRVLRVARDRPDWLDILLHEYAHFRQWVEQPAGVYNADGAAAKIVDGYLHRGKTVPRAVLRKAFNRVMTFERDAEMRALTIAKTHGLPVDPVAYAKHANLYIYSHHLMLESGRWKPVRNLHSSWKVMRMMPKDFKAKAHRSIPRKVYRAIASFFPK
jgi:hypothetical protein